MNISHLWDNPPSDAGFAPYFTLQNRRHSAVIDFFLYISRTQTNIIGLNRI